MPLAEIEFEMERAERITSMSVDRLIDRTLGAIGTSAACNTGKQNAETKQHATR